MTYWGVHSAHDVYGFSYLHSRPIESGGGRGGLTQPRSINKRKLVQNSGSRDCQLKSKACKQQGHGAFGSMREEFDFHERRKEQSISTEVSTWPWWCRSCTLIDKVSENHFRLGSKHYLYSGSCESAGRFDHRNHANGSSAVVTSIEALLTDRWSSN